MKQLFLLTLIMVVLLSMFILGRYTAVTDINDRCFYSNLTKRTYCDTTRFDVIDKVCKTPVNELITYNNIMNDINK